MLKQVKYFELLDRIVEGARFIDQLDKDDPKYKPAMAKYDRLCAKAGELQKEIRERKSA